MPGDTSQRGRLLVHAVLAALTLAFIAPTLGRGLMLYDLGELWFFTDALRDGRVPGRDFTVNGYGPGRYLLLALLFEGFGERLAVVSGLFLALRLAISALAWEVARRFVSDLRAMLPVACLLLAPGPLHKGFYLLGTLLILLLLLRYLEEPSGRRALALGTGVGGVAIFRMDLGGFGLVAGALAVLARRERVRQLPALLLPLGLAAAAGLLWLRSFGADVPGLVLSQVLDDAAKNQGIVHPRYPWPWDLHGTSLLDALLLWLPFPVYGSLLAILGRSVLSGDAAAGPAFDAAARRRLAALLVMGILTCNQVQMKPELGHLLQAGPALWIAAAVLFDQAQQSARMALALPGRRLRILSQSLGILLPGLLLADALLVHRGDLYAGSISIPSERTLPLETRIGRVLLNPGEHRALSGLLSWLDRSVPQGPLWVPANQPLLYALSGRPDVTGYVGVVYYEGEPAREMALLRRLEAARPPVAVYVDDSIEGPERTLELAAPRVHSYLMTHYEETARFGDFVAMRRRDAALETEAAGAGRAGPPAAP
jgi:hypothetical protein